MAKLFCMLLILTYISITISYNFLDRLTTIIDNDHFDEKFSNTVDSPNFDQCVPVEAVKVLGCALSERYRPFKGLFRSICDQHQLCYTCGFANGISAEQCDRWALINMYELCVKHEFYTFASFLHCLKQRIAAIIFLRQHFYRSTDIDLEFVFECQDKCVYDFIRIK